MADNSLSVKSASNVTAQLPTAEHSHAWLSWIFPPSDLTDLEAKFHMGNYVIDRQSGEKAFEPMSIDVRVGMHFLYCGSEQEKALHWEKTLAHLETQSEKMGREYDAPESRAHIEPLIDSFNLRDFFPADCRLTAFPTVELATKYWLKGSTSLFEAFLGDVNLARQFEGGSIVIARLAPQDYHRWHWPVPDTVENIKNILGAYYIVSPQAINE
ncbi:MAG: hypothetical protein Q9187_003579 [Circinaria calcarea]